jgi:hypothetical protein
VPTPTRVREYDYTLRGCDVPILPPTPEKPKATSRSLKKVSIVDLRKYRVKSPSLPAGSRQRTPASLPPTSGSGETHKDAELNRGKRLNTEPSPQRSKRKPRVVRILPPRKGDFSIYADPGDWVGELSPEPDALLSSGRENEASEQDQPIRIVADRDSPAESFLAWLDRTGMFMSQRPEDRAGMIADGIF